MIDEALNAHLDWLDACAKEQTSEHEHIWFVRPKSEVVCLDLACTGRLANAEATAMLNEHAALKREYGLLEVTYEEVLKDKGQLHGENAVLIKRLWDYEHQASDERIRDEK